MPLTKSDLSPETLLVLETCKRRGVNYRSHVTMGVKLELKDRTALPLAVVNKSLMQLKRDYLDT